MNIIKLMNIIIGRVKRAPHWAVQLRFRVIYVFGVSMFVYGKPIQKICMPRCVDGITWSKHVHAQSQFWEFETKSHLILPSSSKTGEDGSYHTAQVGPGYRGRKKRNN